MKKIYDTSVDCCCNSINNITEDGGNNCSKYCRCYCHIPIWLRNLVWWLQGTPNLKR